MTTETITWGVLVIVISGTFLFLLGAGPLVNVFESNWDTTLFGPKPRWAARLKRMVNFFLVAIPALFLLLLLRFWWLHGLP